MKKKNVCFSLVIILGAVMVNPVLANAQSAKGKLIVLNGNGQGAPACAGCHGAQGQGFVAEQAPSLAGIPATAIVGLLQYLAKGGGNSLIMQSVAQALKPDERIAVAAYFSSLPITSQ